MSSLDTAVVASSATSPASSSPSSSNIEEANGSRRSNRCFKEAAASKSVELDERLSLDVPSVIPKKRQDVLTWYGWGYKDSKFYVDNNNVICFQGNRYPLEGCSLPLFTDWVVDKFDLHVAGQAPFPQMPQQFPKPTVNPEFLLELDEASASEILVLLGEELISSCCTGIIEQR